MVAACTLGTLGIGGCLTSSTCDETSNHLYIDNQRSEPQEIDVMVARESDGLFADNNWTPVFDETIEIPGNTYRVFKSVYDEYGTYRTTVEQEMEHDILYERDITEVDDCHDQAITIGIGNGYISILNGLSERIASENDSNSRSDDANS